MIGDRSPKGYRLLILLVASLIPLTLKSVPSAAQTYSHARIVRLSFVEGTVTLHRPGIDQWAKAFINTPIEQGFNLATAANSFAEVEFENGSTARLGQLSELDFTNLSLSSDGNKINHMTLARGYATFTVMPKRGDVYEVHAGGSTYTAADKTMFRVDLEQAGERLEVFKGKVDAQSPYGNGMVAKNQVLELIPNSTKPYQLTDGITEDAWDRWVNKRQQTETVARNRSESGSGNWAGRSLYGWSDLLYYGNWRDLPGYGSCWAPSMGAGWAPYSVGRWAWYPGFGYTWISGLSWGWLPFHYGSWISPVGTGWCWLPGNFSAWSPGLVTWYEGPGWVGWTPRTYGGGAIAGCRLGQPCSTTVSLNTFQSGNMISPNDVIRVHPFRGRAISSPSIPLTRSLRLPGPMVASPPFTPGVRGVRRATVGGAGAAPATSTNAARMRARHVYPAPTRVFARGSIRGAWNVRPHAATVFHSQPGRILTGPRRRIQMLQTNTSRPGHGSVNTLRGRPTVNNDMLLPNRARMRRRSVVSPGGHPASLTSIPISTLNGRRFRKSESTPLMPSVRPSVKMPFFPRQRMRDFRQNRFPVRERSFRNRRNVRSRSQMEMNRRSVMRQQRMERAPTPRPSSRRFGGGMMNRAPRQMGGMRGGPSGGMGGGMRGGGMRGGGAGSHGPHH